MPRKLPPAVERNVVKGHAYLSFRIGKGPRTRPPDDPTSQELRDHSTMIGSWNLLNGNSGPVRKHLNHLAGGVCIDRMSPLSSIAVRSFFKREPSWRFFEWRLAAYRFCDFCNRP